MTVSPDATVRRPRRQSHSGAYSAARWREEKHKGFNWAAPSFRPGWRWWYALAALLVSHGVAYGINGALRLSGVRHFGLGGNLAVSVGVIELDAFMLFAAWLFASRTCRPEPRHFGLRRPVGPRIGRAIALSWFAGRTAAIIGALLTRGHVSNGRAHGTAAVALDVVLVVAVAPVVEEVFYRGFFYGSLRTRLPIAPAALVTGLVFGAVHLVGNGYPPGIALGIGLNGAIWCLLFEYTGSLWPSILLHAYLNATATAAQYGPGLLLPALAGLVLAVIVLRRAAREPRQPAAMRPAASA